MQGNCLHSLIDGKTEDDRARIARRVGERLSVKDLPEAERVAAESLARDLVGDAIERVRRELSLAVKSSKYLPRDVALKIAHDVDAVACPFLEVTEIFSDNEWQQLVLTISRGARMAVARRTSMSEGLALALAEIGNSEAAELLVENSNAPMTSLVCLALVDRFESSTWIMDNLAAREDLSGDIAIRLIVKVSAGARRKLSQRYNIPELTEPIGVEAEFNSVLQLIRETSEPDLLVCAQGLPARRKGTQSKGERVNSGRSVVDSPGPRN